MGSSMKTTIFNENVATALKHWHHKAKKHAKASKHHNGDGTSSHFSSHPATPLHSSSPIHLLQGHNRVSHFDDTPQASPYRASNVGIVDRYDDHDFQFRSPHAGSDIGEEGTSPVARRQGLRRPPIVPPKEGSDQEEADINFPDFSVGK